MYAENVKSGLIEQTQKASFKFIHKSNFGDVFRTLPNIYDGVFCKNS